MIRVRLAVVLALIMSANISLAGETKNVYSGIGGIKENLSGPNKKMIALDDELSLDINVGLIAKGDRLKIVPKTGASTALGWIVVTSDGAESPRGRVRGASREIPADSLLEFSLPDKEQVNLFLPFIRTLADSFIDDPLKGPLHVALIDVINPTGDRTEAGDKLFDIISRHICGRPQFECVKRQKIVEELWRLRVPTSRGLDDATERELKTAIGPAIIVTGHLLISDSRTASLILQARNPENPTRDGGIWRRFDMPAETLGVDTESFKRVTAGFTEARRGLLRFKIETPAELDGLRVDHIGTADLGEWIAGQDTGYVAEPSEHFVFVDGESLAMNPDGRFRDKPVAAGIRRVKIGYYPSVANPGQSGSKHGTAGKKF